jgi:hypothetical protein
MSELVFKVKDFSLNSTASRIKFDSMNYWNQTGIPHKGWDLYNVIDVRENGEEEWEANYETCMMCGKEKIRFVHLVSHPEVKNKFRVGCVC